MQVFDKKINHYQNSKGAALLISVLLISTVAAMALAAGRLMLSEIRITTSMEDAVVAYAAAEAGLEDGLLRYKDEPEIEVPAAGSCGDPNHPSDQSSCIERVGLGLSYASGQICYNNNPPATCGGTGNIPDNTVITKPYERYYDLKIWYRSAVGTGGVKDKHLLSDEIDVYDISGISGDIDLDWQTEPKSGGGNFSGIMETKVYYEESCIPTTAGQNIDFRVLVSPATFVAGEFGDNFLISTSECLTPKKLVVKFLSRDAVADDPLTPGDETVNPEVVYNLDASGAQFDTNVTHIESTGYYGSAKRKLMVNIDRDNGNIMGIFDFVLYRGMCDFDPDKTDPADARCVPCGYVCTGP